MDDRGYELRRVRRCGSTNSELLAEKRTLGEIPALVKEAVVAP